MLTVGNMLYPKIDAKILGYLGRALSLELTAVQQYLTAARLLKLRGFEDVARKCEHESKTEMEHVERIIGRMLVLGVAPNASRLRPAVLRSSLPDLISAIEKLEAEIISFYQQAVNHCRTVNDYDNRVFFERLMEEERIHSGSLSSWHREGTHTVQHDGVAKEEPGHDR